MHSGGHHSFDQEKKCADVHDAVKGSEGVDDAICLLLLLALHSHHIVDDNTGSEERHILKIIIQHNISLRHL